jgi:hypothetical protein
MIIRLYAAAAAIAVLAVASPPQPESDDCTGAKEHYKETVEAVTAALRKYEACVSASNAHDHCSAEVQLLDNAHDDFEDAVSESEKACAAKK